jgi:hypothetical protein
MSDGSSRIRFQEENELVTRNRHWLAVVAAMAAASFACTIGLTTDFDRATPTPATLPTLTPTLAIGSRVADTPSPQLAAQDVAARCAERMVQIKSFHFAVQVTGAPVQMGSLIGSPVPITLKHIEGDVVQPDQLQAQITVSSFGIATHIGLVRIGGETYLNNPLTGGWEQLPAETGDAFNPSLLFNPDSGLPALLPALGMQTVGFDEMQGELAYHLRASEVEGIDMTGFGGRKTVTIEAWIGMESFLLHQASITEKTTDGTQPTVWWLNLSAFDRPLTITPPASRR